MTESEKCLSDLWNKKSEAIHILLKSQKEQTTKAERLFKEIMTNNF